MKRLVYDVDDAVLFRDPLQGMAPNPRFVEIVEQHFKKDARLILGCAAGMRSAGVVAGASLDACGSFPGRVFSIASTSLAATSCEAGGAACPSSARRPP